MLVKGFAVCVFAAGAWVAAPVQDGSAKTGAAAGRSTQEFKIDGVHSSIVFRVTHLGASAFWGRFNKISGSFKVDDAKLGESFIKIEVPADSIDTNNAGRDKHLKSQDFFAVVEYPKVTFASTKVEKTSRGYNIAGDLTLRGVKKPVVATAKHIGTLKMSERFGLRSGYEAEFTFKRTDFGMKYMSKGEALGDQVKVIVAVEGVPAKK